MSSDPSEILILPVVRNNASLPEMFQAVPVGDMARSCDGEVFPFAPTNRTLFEYSVATK
jgi:hypothetical protein